MTTDPYEASVARKLAIMRGMDPRMPEAVRLLEEWRSQEINYLAGVPPSREQQRELSQKTDAFLNQTSLKVWRSVKASKKT